MTEAMTAIGIVVVMIAAMVWAHRVKARDLYSHRDRTGKREQDRDEQPGSADGANAKRGLPSPSARREGSDGE